MGQKNKEHNTWLKVLRVRVKHNQCNLRVIQNKQAIENASVVFFCGLLGYVRLSANVLALNYVRTLCSFLSYVNSLLLVKVFFFSAIAAIVPIVLIIWIPA